MKVFGMEASRMAAIAAKDIEELRGNRMALVPLLVVPLVMCAVVPGGMLAAFFLTGDLKFNGMGDIGALIALYPVPAAWAASEADAMAWIALNYLLLPLFLIVPLMTSSVVAANGIVGERERKTLETLLSTPVSNKEFVAGKFAAALLPALASAALAFALWAATCEGLSFFFRGRTFVAWGTWLPALFLLAPAFSGLGLAAAMAVSFKAKTFMEAQQLAGVVVLPLVAAVAAQAAGFLVLDIPRMAVAAALVTAVDAAVLRFALPRFTREQLIA